MTERRSMKKEKDPTSQILELGNQLGLTTEQIHVILDSSSQKTEQITFPLGPPHYHSGFYGTVSIAHFEREEE